MCAKFGDLQENPLTVHMRGNRLTEAHSENRELESDFWRYTPHQNGNSDRVGEFAIGTNIDLKKVIGQILQDEKSIPGCTLRLAIRTGRTPVQTGIRPRILT